MCVCVCVCVIKTSLPMCPVPRCVVEALGLVRQQGERVEELLAAVFLGCQDLGLMTLLLRLPLHLREQVGGAALATHCNPGYTL